MYLNSDLFLEVSTLMHTTHAHNTNHICMHLVTSQFLLKGLSCYQLVTQQCPYVANVKGSERLYLSRGFTERSLRVTSWGLISSFWWSLSLRSCVGLVEFQLGPRDVSSLEKEMSFDVVLVVQLSNVLGVYFQVVFGRSQLWRYDQTASLFRCWHNVFRNLSRL